MHRPLSSPYMHWVKTQAAARYSLVISGLRDYPISLLHVNFDELALSGPGAYGYRPLVEALAEKCGVHPEMIATAQGTSMANFLAMSALLEPGDEVLVERPGYPLIWETAQYLGANVRFFPRHLDIDIDELRSAVSERTRLIAITNLHNPTCAYLDSATLEKIGEIAASVNARVLVDEVYLDLLFENKPQTAAKLGPRFVVTNSLTKAYGLSGLRCGWIVAEPALIRRIYAMNDFMGVNNAYLTDQISCIALRQASRILAENRELLERNRAIAADLGFTLPHAGTVIFAKLEVPVDHFCNFLRHEYETVIVPGHFFGSPDHVRIGFAGDTGVLREGLRRVRQALMAYRM